MCYFTLFSNFRNSIILNIKTMHLPSIFVAPWNKKWNPNFSRKLDMLVQQIYEIHNFYLTYVSIIVCKICVEMLPI